MSNSQIAVASDPARKAEILSALKRLVNDLTGIDPEDVDIHANFLEVGIDSLTLIQATQLVKEQYDVKLSVVQVLEQLTNLDALASYIDHELPPAPAAEVAAPPAASDQTPPAPAAPVSDARAAAPPPPAAAAEEPPASAAPPAFTPPAPPPVAPRPAPAHLGMTELPRNLPPAPYGGEQASALDYLMSQQLQVMAQQLEMLRAAYHDANGARPQTFAPQTAAADVSATPAAGAGDEANASPSAPPPAAQVAPAPPAPPTAAPAAPAPSAQTSARAASIVHNQPAYVPYQPIEPGTTGGLTERQRRHLDELIARRNERTRESKRLTQEFRAHLADSRTSFGFRLLWKELVYPIISDRASGSRVWDVDGNEYVDISMGFGVHLFGHSPDFIDRALQHQIERKAVQLGPQVYLAGKVARLFSEVTGQERVNFCNSGTEAVMGAMRIARTVTRRSRIAIFAGAYHGWSDLTLAKVSPQKGERRSVPVGPGISPRAVEDVVVLDWDSPASLEYLKEHARELAAVMVEPVQSRRPDIQPGEFLRQLRTLTADAGAALIFDEMITGFRIHAGGAQAWFGVQADISTYGKVIGGGLPVGLIAGKAAYMDAFDGGMWDYGDDSYPEAEKTIFAGAFFKHPLTMSAAHAILERLRDEPSLLPELNARTARLVAMLNRVFEEAALPITVVNFASLFRFMISPELKFVDLFFYHLLEQGVYLWEGRNCFLSTAHTEEDLERVARAVAISVEQMRAGGFWPEPDRAPGGGGEPSVGAVAGAAGADARTPATNGGPSAASASVTHASVREVAEAAGPSRAAVTAPRFSL
jgi:iturin family lipopeptide synthetase A